MNPPQQKKQDENGNSAVEVSTSGLKISSRSMAELVCMLSLCIIAVVAYIIFTHHRESEASAFRIERAVTDMASRNRDALAGVERSNNRNAVFVGCIMAVPQERRLAAFSGYCKELATAGDNFTASHKGEPR